MKRRAFTLLGILAVVLATGQAPDNDEATGLLESECYSCHKDGGGSLGPPLQIMYAVLVPDDVAVAVGTPFEYRIEVHNGWTSELLDITAELDLRDAPSLGFASNVTPILGRQQTGTLATAAATGERTAQVTMDVPPGLTDLRLRLVPSDTGLGTAPDLILRVWPGPKDGTAAFEVDEGGTGGTEELHLRGGAQISALGTGTWTVEAAQQALLAGIPGIIPQEFTVVMDAWGNTTGEQRQTTATANRLDGQQPETPQSTSLGWGLLADALPAATESVNVTVNVTSFYAHPGSVSRGIDGWAYTKTIRLPLRGGVGETPVQIGTGGEEAPPVPTEIEAGLPWDRIGEIVGYVSAFLLVASILSGGMFGKTNRRILNKWFRGARRRIAFHNFLSYGLTVFAIAHTVLFLFEPAFPWELGVIWGSLAMLAMILLGVTGALQVPMIRRWNYGLWRWTHFWLAIAAIVFTLVHMVLDGANFSDIADKIGWEDPLLRIFTRRA